MSCCGRMWTNAMVSFRFSILVSVLFGFCGVLAQDGKLYPRLVVLPDLQGKEKILKEGESVSFTCTFEADENDQNTKADKLYWVDKYNTEIGNDPSMPVYINVISGHVRRMLVLVVKGHEAISGSSYSCGGEFNGENLQLKTVRVHVFIPPRWVDHQSVIIGHLNENIQIDCRTKPSPMGNHIDTVIMFQNNTPLPFDNPSASRYHVALPGPLLHIRPVTMAERNAAVQCTALEMRSTEKVLLRADKTVKIDLQFAPILAQPDAKYGIMGGQVLLPCRVLDSNPPVANFEFYSGSDPTPIQNSSKYRIEIDIDHQVATLTIFDLTDDDFEHRYYCDAETENKNFRARMEYKVRKAFPPEVPEATVIESGPDSVILNITEVDFGANQDNPPAHSFEIRLVPFDIIFTGQNDSDTRTREAFVKTLPRLLNKTDSNLYVLDNLDLGKSYKLEIRAINVAGRSDAQVRDAITLARVSSAVRSWNSQLTIIWIICTVHMSNWLVQH